MCFMIIICSVPQYRSLRGFGTFRKRVDRVERHKDIRFMHGNDYNEVWDSQGFVSWFLNETIVQLKL